MTADDEHADLDKAWARLRRRLKQLPQQVEFGADTFQVEYDDKANRGTGLTVYLDAAVELSKQHLYGPALAITRSGLERVALDWLVNNGNTYVHHASGVSEEDWLSWQDDRASGAAWTASVVEWRRTKKGDVTIRRGGLYSEPDERGHRDRLSIYYFVVQEYDGMVGKPSEQQEDDGFLTVGQLRERAATNQQHWRTYLTWSALLENLEVNGLIGASDVGRLATHYRFLSTFAHPVIDDEHRLYGGRRPSDPRGPRYDHFASELVLLYVVSLAALALRVFVDGLDGGYDVGLRDRRGAEVDLDFAERVTDHFWFMGTNPHPWDVHRVMNEAALADAREGTVSEIGLPRPADVPFPRDPLSRLVSLHRHSRGRIPGQEYRSPWPRADAAGRS